MSFMCSVSFDDDAVGVVVLSFHVPMRRRLTGDKLSVVATGLSANSTESGTENVAAGSQPYRQPAAVG